MKRYVHLILVVMVFCFGFRLELGADEKKVDQMLQEMSLNEKVGQMVQISSLTFY